MNPSDPPRRNRQPTTTRSCCGRYSRAANSCLPDRSPSPWADWRSVWSGWAPNARSSSPGAKGPVRSRARNRQSCACSAHTAPTSCRNIDVCSARSTTCQRTCDARSTRGIPRARPVAYSPARLRNPDRSPGESPTERGPGRRRCWRTRSESTLFGDAAGLPRAPSRIVPADYRAIRAAADTLDRGGGTVWAADARDGPNGGGLGLRWVRPGDDGRESFALEIISGSAEISRR